MAVAGIHQLVAGYSNGDAISNEARQLRELFRSWGFAPKSTANPAESFPNCASMRVTSPSRRRNWAPMTRSCSICRSDPTSIGSLQTFRAEK